ncbi:unnamed protein product [Effrenium voratum]|nr:unnamed protein product [Effrenium voratum]
MNMNAEDLKVLQSPRALREWLQGQLLQSEEEVQFWSAEHSRFSEEQMAMIHSGPLPERVDQAGAWEAAAVLAEVAWCNQLIASLTGMHRAMDSVTEGEGHSELWGAQGLLRHARGRVAAARWCTLVGAAAERAAQQAAEAAGARAGEGRRLRIETLEAELAALSRQAPTPPRQAVSELEATRLHGADGLRDEVRQAEAMLQRERNAVVITEDAIWTCRQEASVLQAQAARRQQESDCLAWEHSELEGQIQRLQPSELEERQAAVFAAEEAEEELEEQLRAGRRQLAAKRLAAESLEQARDRRAAEGRQLRLELRQAEQAIAAGRGLSRRQEEISMECEELRLQRREEEAAAAQLAQRKERLVAERAAELSKGQSWEARLRGAGEEVRDARRALHEEDAALRGRRRAVRAAVPAARGETDSPFAVASSERRAKLVGELRVAEELYQESCAQVAEMRAALKRMQLGRSVESMDVDGGGESISALRASSASQPDLSAQQRQWRLQEERVASVRLRRFAARLASESAAEAAEAHGDEGMEPAAGLSPASSLKAELVVEPAAPSPTLAEPVARTAASSPSFAQPLEDVQPVTSIQGFLHMKAREVRRAVLRGEIHAAEAAAGLKVLKAGDELALCGGELRATGEAGGRALGGGGVVPRELRTGGGRRGRCAVRCCAAKSTRRRRRRA